MAISGRGRKPQFELAKKLNVNDYPCPAGGCLLTYREFAEKVRDLFRHEKKVSLIDIELLKIGRHFRFEKNKIICGKNKEENKKLLALKKKGDFVFEVPDIGSPIVLLQGKKTKAAIKTAAQIALHYSDCKDEEAAVELKKGKSKKSQKLLAKRISEEEIEKIRV